VRRWRDLFRALYELLKRITQDMTIVDLFNGVEAAFWFGLAVFVFWRFGRAGAPHRRLALQSSLWLLLFAVSDVIEVFTGAWSRPLGLLVLKGVCLLGLILSGWQAIRARRKQPLAGK